MLLCYAYRVCVCVCVCVFVCVLSNGVGRLKFGTVTNSLVNLQLQCQCTVSRPLRLFPTIIAAVDANAFIIQNRFCNKQMK